MEFWKMVAKIVSALGVPVTDDESNRLAFGVHLSSFESSILRMSRRDAFTPADKVTKDLNDDNFELIALLSS